METKLWISLCALLLLNLGSAEHDDDHAAASPKDPEVAASTPAADLVSVSGLDQTRHAVAEPAANESDANTGSDGRISNTSMKWDGPSASPRPKEDNDTNMVSASVASFSEKTGNLTDEPTSQTLIGPSESGPPTSHAPTPSTATVPTHGAHTSTASHPPAAPPPDSIPSSSQATLTTTRSTTSSPTLTPTGSPPKAKPESTMSTVSSRSGSTPSTSSYQEPPNSQPPAHTSTQTTSQPDAPPQTSSEARPKTTPRVPSSLSTQTRAHANTPSQLNVKGDTLMVHESPTLDPLLAGLVSAFIITAVIITLLLFIKLRRRDNRPEFRRLQDLPMDDMMEDTPLSMYSY